jgi:CheY-like chemotaxis protein
MQKKKSKKNPVLYVEDAMGDISLLKVIFKDLEISNELHAVLNGQEALDYLRKYNEVPFIIFSDINMPVMDGIELKKEINEDSRLHALAIPFIFFSTSDSPADITKAYDVNAQGYFVKRDYDSLCEDVKAIFTYWNKATVPATPINNF